MVQGSLRWSMVAMLIVAQGCIAGPKDAAGAPNPPQASAQLPPSRDETLSLLNSNQFAELDRRFSAIQVGYKTGIVTDRELRADFRVFYSVDVKLQSKYDAWVARFPKSYVARLARGIYYKKVGQSRRGANSIGNTTNGQIRGMEAAFEKGSEDLHASINLDEKPLLTYFHAMDMARFLGQDDEVRELLDLANRLDTNNIIVREEYMATLEPRWGGSVKQMHAYLDDSRKSGLSAAHLQLLEAVIVEEQAHTDMENGDFAAAERGFRRSMQMGNETCLACFGNVLMIEKKFADAIPILSKALELNPGDSSSLGSRGRAYMATGQKREGLSDLTAAAESGDSFAQNDLGGYYLFGVSGVLPQDPNAALSWFSKAAAQGNDAASHNVEAARAYIAAHSKRNQAADSSPRPAD